MSDLTKEELEHILYAYKESEIACVAGLGNKIQSMIDNYCEHESDQIDWVVSYPPDICLGYDFVNKCKKCGAIITND